MKKCDGCMWWSEMLAYADGGGPVKAMCLNESSPRYKKYSVMGCDFKSDGPPIDDITRCQCEPDQGGPCSFCMEGKYNS